jgi:hypothetical protein
MAADGSKDGDVSDRIGQIFAAFAREVFNPLVALTGVPAEDRRQLVDEIRKRLDLVDQVIDTNEAATSYARPKALGAALEAAIVEDTEESTAAFDEIGRNQRSRVRELVLLETLGRETKAYSLQQLLGALSQRGFRDTPSAVVSQLHRLKKLELIRQPAGSTGMYEITNAGLGHARSLRSGFAAYVP